MNPIRVLLVDDHAVLRAGLRALLGGEPGIEVVGDAGTGEEGVEKAAALLPDVVVMDLTMPGMGGLEATRAVLARCPATRVLILTVHAEAEYLLPVLEAGAGGYVTKHSADRELVEAIRVVARGDVFLYPSAARLLARSLRGGPAPARGGTGGDPLGVLSAREKEVMVLTAEGFSSAEIGERLSLSHKTVETYRQRMMDKLHLTHRSELIRLALREGVLSAATV